ncbi:hypothetical protein M9H77_27409 [Catharanthus roseus]|uniref:Uncharacterized protein n=1 Tax=Catharanthus roseus TaxID=4058 RepID=A0ACC0AD01_CATRO|nr:hypothetical protein M9H77_27409 [Catharanthus roseus]
MSVQKIETDKFDGKSDFVMWQRKMKAVLIQNKIAPAICSPKEYQESWKGEIFSEKLGDAHSCFTLHLTDNNISDENIAVILLNTLPESFNNVKSAIKYGRDGLSLSDVKNALKSKDLDLQKENKSHGENLFVRGRVDRREPPSHCFKSKGRFKSRGKNKVKCFYCGKEGHMKIKCFK